MKPSLVEKLSQADVANLSDSEALAIVASPIRTAVAQPGRVVDYVTWSTLPGRWGGPRAMTVRATLIAMAAQTKSPELAALAGYAVDVLGGRGLDRYDGPTIELAQGLIAAGAFTQAEWDTLGYDVSTPFEGTTLADITAARAKIAAFAAMMTTITSEVHAAERACADAQSLAQVRFSKLARLQSTGDDCPADLTALDQSP